MHGNTAYLQAQLLVERQQRKIADLERQIHDQQMDIVTWKTRFINTQCASYFVTRHNPDSSFNREMLEKLMQKVPEIGAASVHSKALPAAKDLPAPLDPKDYRRIQFWTAKSFETYCNDLVGETDGLATRHKKRGRRPKDDEDDDRHPYLETVDGTSVAREVLVKVGQKARRLWQALNTAGLAPSSWGKASEVAYTYFNSQMLNEADFQFFRYCEGNWKLNRWATKAYASWKHNHLKTAEGDDRKAARNLKRKREALDDPGLFQISDDENRDSSSSAKAVLVRPLTSSTTINPSSSTSTAHVNPVCLCPCHEPIS